MKKNIVFFAVIAIVFIVIGAYVAWQRQAPVPAQGSVSALLYSQTLPDSKGANQSLSQWKGKILIVNFWATWCAPCVEEMPELVALQKEKAENNVQVIGIGIDTASNISEFSSKHEIDYPLYVAGMAGTELSRQFGNQAGGLPYTVLISPDGRIKKAYLGRLKMDQLRRDLMSL